MPNPLPLSRQSNIERWWLIDGDSGTDWGTDAVRAEAARKRGDFVDGPFIREADSQRERERLRAEVERLRERVTANERGVWGHPDQSGEQ